MCTYYHIGDHLVQALVLRCVLITTLVTIWYNPRVKVCTYYHIGDHLVQALVLSVCTYYHIGDHLVQALVLRCVLITTLVTIWYKPSC